MSAAMVGNATAADVLAGKTFTNSTTSGVTGTMPSNSNNSAAVSTDRSGGTDRPGRVFFNYGYYPKYNDNHPNQGYVSITDAQAVTIANKQEKTVTAGTSSASVTPDSGKLLSKVTYNPTPSQTKSCTPSTSAQTIKPDSGKLLSQVSVSAIQTETKNINLKGGNTNTQQTITPSSGKYLTSVKIPNIEFAQNSVGTSYNTTIGSYFLIIGFGAGTTSAAALQQAIDSMEIISGAEYVGTYLDVGSGYDGSASSIKYSRYLVRVIKATATTIKFKRDLTKRKLLTGI